MKYDVIAKVISQKGRCVAGHKVGEELLITQLTPTKMCNYAFQSCYPFITTLQFGGVFPWEKDPDKAIVACPDADNPVVFELKRIKAENKPRQ